MTTQKMIVKMPCIRKEPPTKLDSKSLYFVTRILPRVTAVNQLKEELNRVQNALSQLEKVSSQYVNIPYLGLKLVLQDLKHLLKKEREYLVSDIEGTDMTVFKDYEVGYLNRLINY